MSSKPIKTYYTSNSFYIACGTVTIDRSTSKVLIIYDRTKGIYKLPRGRKNWDETLVLAAERETLEETGVEANVLPVPVETRATAYKGHPLYELAKFDNSGDITSGINLVEPIALMMEYQPDGALAVTFWFVAAADSAMDMLQGTQMDDEDYEASWVDFDKASELMCNEDYVEVLKNAVRTVKRLDMTICRS